MRDTKTCSTNTMMKHELCTAPLAANIKRRVLQASREFDFNQLNEQRVATGVSVNRSDIRNGSGNVGISSKYGSRHFTIHRNLKKLTATGHNSLIAVLIEAVCTTFPKFKFTNIQMNKNFPGKLHIDRGNIGKSIMIVVADPSKQGGDLFVSLPPNRGRSSHLDCLLPVTNMWVWFDGTNPHATMPTFGKGDRYSYVFFTSENSTLQPRTAKLLRNIRSLKFQMPDKRVAKRWLKKRKLKTKQLHDNLLRARKIEPSVRRAYTSSLKNKL